MKASWITPVLVVQMLLSFFAPPIARGERLIFAGDLWFWLWVPFALVMIVRQVGWKSREAKRLYLFLGVSAAILLVVFVHGSARESISLRALLRRNFRDQGAGWGIEESDEFSWTHELVLCARFVSWIWAARIVAFLRPSIDVKKLWKVGFGTLIVCAIVIVLEKVSHGFAATLGALYRFDPFHEHWIGRASSVFRSPVEAGVAFGLLGAVLAVPAKSRAAVLAATGVGLALARTMTAIAFAAVAGVVVGFFKLPKRTRGLFVIMSVVSMVALFFAFVNERGSLIYHKFNDFTFRFGPWGVYVKAAFKRLDFALLGFGFVPYHADNSYVFLFTRGGFLLLGAALFVAGCAIKKYWRGWNAYERGLVVYFALLCLTTDTVIFRHAVAIMITLGIPVLLR